MEYSGAHGRHAPPDPAGQLRCDLRRFERSIDAVRLLWSVPLELPRLRQAQMESHASGWASAGPPLVRHRDLRLAQRTDDHVRWHRRRILLQRRLGTLAERSAAMEAALARWPSADRTRHGHLRLRRRGRLDALVRRIS